MSRLLPLLLVGAVCVACERPAERHEDRDFAAKVLTGILAYPQSSVVGVAAGSEAAQATLSAPDPVGQVAQWYRQVLHLNGWELESDVVAADGSISIMARKDKRPLWITLKPTVGGPGTTYTLIGADITQDTAGTQRSGSSMSSNRIQRR